MFTPVVVHPDLLYALKVADARGEELDIGGALVIILSHGGVIGIHLQGGEGVKLQGCWCTMWGQDCWRLYTECHLKKFCG